MKTVTGRDLYIQTLHSTADTTRKVSKCRLRWSYLQGTPPFWFKWHVGLQRAGVVVAMTGFGVAVAMQHAGRHFLSTHSALGLAVTVMGVMQPVNAMIRPKPSPRTAWRRVRVLAVGSVTTGVDESDPHG